VLSHESHESPASAQFDSDMPTQSAPLQQPLVHDCGVQMHWPLKHTCPGSHGELREPHTHTPPEPHRLASLRVVQSRHSSPPLPQVVAALVLQMPSTQQPAHTPGEQPEQ
jgi:hypothetical protein